MPTISTTNLGPYYELYNQSDPIPPAKPIPTKPFTVNVNDLGPSMNPDETILEMGGGYVGAPTHDLPGYAGYGVNYVNAPNLTLFEKVELFVQTNPISSALIGIGVLMLFSGRGRR